MIPVAAPVLGDKELEYVTDCIRSGWVSSLGEYVRRFEREFAAYCGVRYGVATHNGTVALHLVLAALGIGPGDEVIVPSLTFVATANAVAYTGATPGLRRLRARHVEHRPGRPPRGRHAAHAGASSRCTCTATRRTWTRCAPWPTSTA